MKPTFPCIELPARSMKPRNAGLTMVLDKNLGVSAMQDWLGSSADHVDLVKMGWGTAVTLDEFVVRAKCELAHQHGVMICPGGTLTELAWLQGQTANFLSRARELGFSCLEISDGTVSMSHSAKLQLIEQALKAGFKVLSEVGSKSPQEDRRISIDQRTRMIKAELEAGVWKVILEARESGRQGIFNQDGCVKPDMLNSIMESVPVSSLLFEAPLREQQTELIKAIGSDVNLGNVAPGDVTQLETLRLGLRSDTMMHFHLRRSSVKIGLGPSAAWAAAQRGDVVIVVDALRASSTIITALAHGARSVKPVSSVEACVGEVTAGERGGHKIAHLAHDNSPLRFVSGICRGKQLVLTTTNGTECLVAAASSKDPITLVGALINASAVGRRAGELALATKRSITIICAGRNGEMAREDLIAASEIATSIHGFNVEGDIDPVYTENFQADFLNSDSGKNLCRLGKTDDVLFCAVRDRYSTVPRWQGDALQADCVAESGPVAATVDSTTAPDRRAAHRAAAAVSA